MKQTFFTLVAAVLIAAAFAGCSDNGTGNGNLLGGNGNNTVDFTMGTQQGTNGIQFTWKPSVDVKVTRMILSTSGFSDTITDNSGQTYTANQTWAYPQEYTGVTSGQTWQFVFTGTVVSNNQAYTSNINYNIP